MATVILSHKVRDFEAWKPHYDKDIARRNAAGLQEVALGRNAEDPSEVVIVYHTEDPEKVQQMASDPGLKQAMDDAGVISELKATVLI